MLEVSRAGGITVFRMGRSIGPVVPYFAHCFLVDGLMIDTGTLFARKELLAALGGAKISRIVNTHHHEDHIGNNAAIARIYGSPVLAHAAAIPFLADPRLIRLKAYQRVVWGLPEPSAAADTGAIIRSEKHIFSIIHTPGHAESHICIHEPTQGWLFTGDLFCGSGIKYYRSDEDFNSILASLKAVASLPVSTVFCGLLGRVENGAAALRKKIDRMEELALRAHSLRGKGESPAGIRKALLGSEGPMHYITGGHFAKQVLVCMCRADGVMHYITGGHFAKQHVIDSILGTSEEIAG